MYSQLLRNSMIPARHFSVVSARYFTVAPARMSIVDSAKSVLHKVNKKTGEVLADTLETTEKVVPTTENVKNAAEEANLKTGRVMADGLQKAEDVSETVKEKFHDQTEEWTTSPEKKRVSENAQGYKDLQDKGSHAEREQQRPDDGM